MGWLLVLMSAMMLPLQLLNILDALVGGVWLAVLGEWRIIGSGLVFMIGGAFFCSIPLLLGSAFSFPGLKMWESGNFLLRIISLPFLVVGVSWTYVVMTVWAFGAFLILLKGMGETSNPLPYLLWAYAAANGPWAYMLQKDLQAGNDSGVIALFFLQIACITLAVGIWLEIDWLSAMFWLIMAVSLVIGLLKVALAMLWDARHPDTS